MLAKVMASPSAASEHSLTPAVSVLELRAIFCRLFYVVQKCIIFPSKSICTESVARKQGHIMCFNCSFVLLMFVCALNFHLKANSHCTDSKVCWVSGINVFTPFAVCSSWSEFVFRNETFHCVIVGQGCRCSINQPLYKGIFLLI